MGHTASLAWDAARATFLAALAAERQHDVANVDPHVSAGNIDAVPSEAWMESERLGDLRHEAEDALMALPAATAEHFALKFLIARADGRGADQWDEALERDARRFVPDYPASDAP